jgi:hypothetical protein
MRAATRPSIYSRDGDLLMREVAEGTERIILVPDAVPSKVPDPTPRIRIMWGQHLLDDLVAGRYRSLVCAVNDRDNSHGIIAQLAAFLPTSQWNEQSITEHSRRLSSATRRTKVLKFDLDTVEVLAVLRPPGRDSLTLEDLGVAMRMVSEMIRTSPHRAPSASVSFLEARANLLVDEEGKAPTFEAVLQVMYEAGYTGDVYPSPAMWRAAPTGVFARYPFAASLDARREGGF